MRRDPAEQISLSPFDAAAFQCKAQWRQCFRRVLHKVNDNVVRNGKCSINWSTQQWLDAPVKLLKTQIIVLTTSTAVYSQNQSLCQWLTGSCCYSWFKPKTGTHSLIPATTCLWYRLAVTWRTQYANCYNHSGTDKPSVWAWADIRVWQLFIFYFWRLYFHNLVHNLDWLSLTWYLGFICLNDTSMCDCTPKTFLFLRSLLL